jgi:hypothetical protein
MNALGHEPLDLTSQEIAILSEMLEVERATLLVGIRHTDHRAYRDELRRRLAVVETLGARLEHL